MTTDAPDLPAAADTIAAQQAEIDQLRRRVAELTELLEPCWDAHA